MLSFLVKVTFLLLSFQLKLPVVMGANAISCAHTHTHEKKMQLYFYEMCLNHLEDQIEVLSVAQFCLIHCDLRAGGHSINSQGSPLVPASPGLWQCCSCLCVCVCVCGDVLPHYTMHTWHVCIWANVSVETAVCMVHCGGRAPRDVLAVTSTTGDTPRLVCLSASQKHFQ